MTSRSPRPENAEIEALVDEFAHRLASADVVFGHGTDNAWDEARRLVTGFLRGRELAAAAREQLHALLDRRIEERLPVPYLTGEAWFHGLRIRVAPGVMIPRSPIAEALAAGAVRPYLAGEPSRILDLCCGAGAIGILAAHLFPTAAVDLADDDPAARRMARDNALRAGGAVASRIAVVASDLFDSLRGRRYDLVLCNPPYVPTAELDAAPAEFRHEPRHGLDGGADGLTVWRRIVDRLDSHLAAEGVLVGEVGNLGREFDAAFPELGAVWLDLQQAEVQADGHFGVFASALALRKTLMDRV